MDTLATIDHPLDNSSTTSAEPDDEHAGAHDGDMDWDDDSPLPPRGPKLFTPMTWVLSAVLIGGGMFTLGAKLGKSAAPKAVASANGRSSGAGATGAAATRAATGTAAGTGSTAAAATGASARAGGVGAGVTTGQVQLVDGTNIYIQDSQGNVIRVTTGPTATITVNKPGTPADFKPGDTVIVQGPTDANGNIAATSVSTSTGGFGRGNGGGATTPSSTSTTGGTSATGN